MQKAGGKHTLLYLIAQIVGLDKESMMNTQGINSGAHAATLKGKINALEVYSLIINLL